MKNLTIKKIALGVFLAGYAASGAFAGLTATTNATIKGTAPFVNAKSKGADAKANSVDIEIYRKDNGGSFQKVTDGTLATGDKVKVIWKTYDADGDTESAALETGNTVQFGYTPSSGSDVSKLAPSSKAVGSGDLAGYNYAEWIIPPEAKGAKGLYYYIRPTTQYGAPINNDWVSGDIRDGKGTESGGSSTDPVKPSTPGGTGGGTSGGDGNGGGVIKGSETDFSVFIYKSGTTTKYDKSNSSAPNPNLNETFVAKTVETADESKDHTTEYTYTWILTEGNLEAGGLANATDVDITSLSTTTDKETIQIPATNAPVKSLDNTVIAGAQGFKLHVKATEK